ncbi:hypothetical protein CDL15_Pgr004437 [Punica granatum]|uniref:Protein ALTERED PHOSPHATE STARVATION RESPONSE 1 n=1 Tax=Punica granatum TaxID=22663 RepID=A0A218XGZ4_PUNGR|nr:hypothetical protein CDL15_Pgr004437 [Punica granatum]
MGCASSKLDDLPAVGLCQERCSFLDEAIRQRYAFADAHLAYISSLKSIAHSLHDFFELTGPYSPVLNLPPHRKGSDPAPAAVPAAPKGRGGGHGHSRSDSGSHLHFPSDSDGESGSGSVSLHHSGHSSPVYFHGGSVDYASPSQVEANMISSHQGGFLHMNYMKKKATPSVVYEQRPPASGQGTIHFGESSSSSSSYYPYPYQLANTYPYNGYPNYGDAGGGGSSGGGGYGYSSPPPPSYGGYGYSQAPIAAAESSTKPPPPPPSPPQPSAWEFLNPFETFDRHYSPYTPSRDSREVREEEGIPDLEDEGYQHEVVKKVHGNQKISDAGNYSNAGNYSKAVAVDDPEDREANGKPQMYRAGPGPAAEGSGAEYEVHVVDKKVVDDDGERQRSEERPESAGRPKGFRGVFDAVKEIKIQFERASEAGNEIAKMLEAGKLPYRRKHQVTPKMVQVVTPPSSVLSSKASTSTTTSTTTSTDPSSSSEVSGPASVDEDVGMRSGNLSSSLHKLYLWEKKLYNEVKAEEKMRVNHDRKVQKLMRLDQRGAEATKVDATRTLIRNLSTKIRIAIQVVDKISVTINKIRDEELWPQLNELIEGLTRMWKCMLECHQTQCQVIGEGGLGPIGSGKMLSDVHLEATLQFERELINWTLRFSSWISAQKGFVKALNNWLLKCLLYEPEETPDGIAPFSPGRIGAPPVFVICNQWTQALERISEKEVLNAMRDFVMGLLHIWKQDKLEMRQRMEANKDLEKKVKNLDREDQRIHKEIQAMDKKMVLFAGDGDDLAVAGPAIYPSDMSIDLQASLRRIFEAMERFMDSSSRAYEELLQRCEEEEKLAQERGRGS